MEDNESHNDTTATGKEVTGKDITGKDITGKDATAKDVTAKDVTGKDVTGKDVTGKDVTGNDVPEKDGSDDKKSIIHIYETDKDDVVSGRSIATTADMPLRKRFSYFKVNSS